VLPLASGMLRTRRVFKLIRLTAAATISTLAGPTGNKLATTRVDPSGVRAAATGSRTAGILPVSLRAARSITEMSLLKRLQTYRVFPSRPRTGAMGVWPTAMRAVIRPLATSITSTSPASEPAAA